MSFLHDMHGKGLTNRIATIERDAIGWAAGYYVATEKIGVVYMQNSGLGNIVNPLTSLTAPEVYNIPVLLMIGWRGRPGEHDEPQHVNMGGITLPLLELLEIRYSILSASLRDAEQSIVTAKQYMQVTNQPYGIVINKGTFVKYEQQKNSEETYDMKREEALKLIIDGLDGDEIIVSTTGKTSRELFEYREETNVGHHQDFLMVGSMGLASSFAAEIALQKPSKKVIIFDGDGALLMNAGGLSTIGYYAPKNLSHIVFDNASYDSTGGQPTTSPIVSFDQLALAHSYKGAQTVSTKNELQLAVQGIKQRACPYMLIVKVRKGARQNLGRPTTIPIENRNAFMRRVSEDT
jgi:phosphonopyruvate decarboxylase